MQAELGLPATVARLVCQRGFTQIDDAQAFLQASLAQMPDPALLADIDRAASRLLTAVKAGHKITVYGDYDVDGVTSSSVLWLFFRDVLGIEIDVYIPHRLREGYGLNIAAIERLAQDGTQVLVTVDNGSSAVDEVARASELGMDVIIIDHHQISDPEPQAFAHLNPHRATCAFPYKGLAAVGVAFLLIVQLRRALRDADFFTGPDPRPDRYLDLVALGTVADLAPLTGLNRAMVRYGVGVMAKQQRVGVGALFAVTRTDGETLSAQDLGFRLGPRINAAGRLDDATRGFRLLTGDDVSTAHDLALQIEEQNLKRRDIQQQMTDEALEMAQAQMPEAPSALVLASADWHPGVVGIVASRIVEEFHRPAILLAEDGGVLKGSGRSTSDVNIKAALDKCAPFLMKYGGHVGAAGLTVNPGVLDSFRAAFLDAVDEVRDGSRQTPPLTVDGELPIYELSEALVAEIHRVGPFGQDNPMPRFLAHGVVGRSRILKGGHLKLFFDDAPFPVEAIGWNMGECEDWCRYPVDIVYTPSREVWRGRSKIVLRIHDLRPSEAR